MYCFKTRLYGLTIMLAGFQKKIDTILIGLTNTYCLLGVMLIVSCGTLEEHVTVVRNCLKKQDNENL